MSCASIRDNKLANKFMVITTLMFEIVYLVFGSFQKSKEKIIIHTFKNRHQNSLRRFFTISNNDILKI